MRPQKTKLGRINILSPSREWIRSPDQKVMSSACQSQDWKVNRSRTEISTENTCKWKGDRDREGKGSKKEQNSRRCGGRGK